MDNLLSIVIFLPLLAALSSSLILRGDDAAAQKNAKVLGAWWPQSQPSLFLSRC